jgi:hypothetical protein
MRWLNLAEFDGHKLSLPNRILLLSFILCLLVAFTPGMAEDDYDPDTPVFEHPWDDLERSNPRQNSPGGSVVTDHDMLIRFGWSGLWVIIDIRWEKEKNIEPTERISGSVLLLLR